jgi:hypothetical protein
MANIVSSISHEFDAALVASIRERVRMEPFRDGKASIESLVWSVATRVRHEIRKATDAGTKNNNVGVMGLVSDWRVLMRSRERRPRDESWIITNLGVVDGGSEEDWRIERASFSISAHVIGAAINVCAVAVKGKELCVDFTWQDCVVDVEVAEQLVSDVKDWLTYIGAEA